MPTLFLIPNYYKLNEDYPHSGLIGQDILRQFSRVIIDYVKETITFEK